MTLLFQQRRGGYIFLISVLVIGAIASATAVSLLLLGWAAEQNGQVVAESAQAYEYAHACTERALLSLRSDLGYAGSGTVTFASGQCAILPLGGSGNEQRTICSEGRAGGNVRRLQLRLTRVFPSVTVSSWQEVSSFTLCP